MEGALEIHNIHANFQGDKHGLLQPLLTDKIQTFTHQLKAGMQLHGVSDRKLDDFSVTQQLLIA